MIPYGFRQHQRSSDHHWMLACVALLLSAVIHMLMMFFFADWSLGGSARLRERRRERFDGGRVPPMRIETMQSDPMLIGKRVPGERDEPSRGPIEAGERVDDISQSADTVLTPPPVPREALAPGVLALKDSVSDQIDTTPWMPRQEIAQIFDRVVQDEVALLPRREIPMVERIPQAPDIVPSIDLAGRSFGKAIEPPKPLESAEIFDTEIRQGTYKPPPVEIPESVAKVQPGATGERFALKPGERGGAGTDGGAGADGADGKADDRKKEKLKQELDQAEAQGRLTADGRKALETQAAISEMQDTIEYVPIDDLLAVGMETYRDPARPEIVYFRIGVQPRADKHVPVIPKDILFVQDVSASMSEDRMTFCRSGLSAALQTLNPADRFNVVAFRDNFEPCSPEWMDVTAGNLGKAAAFVDRMRAFGQTDVFGSLQALMKLPRDPKRPMIAVIVTDGKPTSGVTESAQIIGEFSNLNNGMISVYMFGTISKANVYLLDMLTYCNRGTSSVLRGNRWEIPDAMARVYEGVRNPVMGDITVTFDTASRSEVYPKGATNLYKDRQLELCGVCPADTEELIFQIRGLAAGKGYDSIFRLNMARHAQAGTDAVKSRWAIQKMYHLVGVYSREAAPQTMETMRRLNQEYGVAIPYADQLK
ncbi:MAG: VWA domain-containing protein [Kiritimatiellae bacterium]|nr:VWA domain-containing protein [Kiritimatiellia bacterium]